jgi:hypothetical protein
MIKKLIPIFFLFVVFESSSQSNFQYEAGISFGYDILLPKSIDGRYEYFNSSYNSGYGYSLGMSNKLNYRKLFLRIQGSFGLAFQSQDFVFSNDVDNIIDHNIKHQIPHWILDYSMGRDFEMNELNKLHFELGFSTIGNFSYGNSSSRFDVSGSFSSTYVAPDDHYDDASIAEYDYMISYYWPTFLSPFIKCGISLPVAKNRLVFGLTARWNRLAYKNFIILSGDNYTAIAESRSQSSSFGFYLNYEFSK